jgi:hypothetical protein
MRSSVQIPGRPLCAVLAVGGVVAALVVSSIAAPSFAGKQPADPAVQKYVASQPTDPSGLMYVASQPAEPPWPGPSDPQPVQAASSTTAAAPEPIFDSEVEGTVRAGSVNLATTGPGAQSFVLTTGKHGDVTIHFPGAPPGTFLSFANGKLSILVNGVQKTYVITGDTKFRPDDRSAANLVGLASGTRVTVVGERDVATGVVIFPR